MSSWDDPLLLFCAAMAALCAAVLLARFALASPRWAIASCYVAVVVASTKLRLRDASASLSGTLDFQILLELALYAAVGIVVATLFLMRRRSLRPLVSAELLLFGYVVLALCSSSWSLIPLFTGIRALQLILLYALAAMSVRVLGSEGTMRAASIVLVVYVLSCSAAVVAGLPWAGAFSRSDYFGFTRFSWFAVHPITAGTYAAVATVSVLAVALSSPRGWKDRRFGVPSWLCMGLLPIILVLTYSRGPFFACIAATSVLILKRAQLRNAILLAAVATLVLLATLGQPLSSDNPLVHALSRGQSVEQLSSFSGRLGLWKLAISQFVESPAIGYGYSASRQTLFQYGKWAGYAHNAFLQTLLDLGIAGALLLWPTLAWVAGATLLRPFDRNHRAAGQQAFVLAIFVCLIVNAISSESFAGAPSYEVLLVFVCTSLASQRWTEAAAFVALQPSHRTTARALDRRLVPVQYDATRCP
jgi:O-antigen ligase